MTDHAELVERLRAPLLSERDGRTFLDAASARHDLDAAADTIESLTAERDEARADLAVVLGLVDKWFDLRGGVHWTDGVKPPLTDDEIAVLRRLLSEDGTDG